MTVTIAMSSPNEASKMPPTLRGPVCEFCAATHACNRHDDPRLSALGDTQRASLQFGHQTFRISPPVKMCRIFAKRGLVFFVGPVHVFPKRRWRGAEQIYTELALKDRFKKDGVK